MAAEPLPSFTSSQWQARPLCAYSGAALQAAAAGAFVDFSEQSTPDPPYRRPAASSCACGGQIGEPTIGSRCGWGISLWWRYSSIRARENLPAALEHPRRPIASAAVCSLLSRLRVSVVVCILLSAGWLFLQQPSLTDGANINAFPHARGGGRDPNGESSNRSAGRTVELIGTTNKIGHICSEGTVSNNASADAHTAIRDIQAANLSHNGSSRRPISPGESLSGDCAETSASRRPCERSSITSGNVATATVGKSCSSSVVRSVEASVSSARTGWEDVTAQNKVHNRSGVWVANAAEDSLSTRGDEVDRKVNGKESVPAEDSDQDNEDSFDLSVEREPLNTVESQDAISFSRLSENSPQPPSPTVYGRSMRRTESNDSLSSTSSGSPQERFFTAHESYFEGLYEEAKRHMQEEEERAQQQQQLGFQEQQPHPQSRQDVLEHLSALLEHNEQSPASLQESLLCCRPASPPCDDAPKQLPRKSIPIFSGTHDAAWIACDKDDRRMGGPEAGDPRGSAALQKPPAEERSQPQEVVCGNNDIDSSPAAEVPSNTTEGRVSYANASATIPSARPGPSEDNKEATVTSATAAQGMPDTDAHHAGRLRPPALTLALPPDNSVPEGEQAGKRLRQRSRTKNSIVAAASGVYSPQAATVAEGRQVAQEGKEEQAAADDHVSQPQQQPSTRSDREIWISALYASGTSNVSPPLPSSAEERESLKQLGEEGTQAQRKDSEKEGEDTDNADTGKPEGAGGNDYQQANIPSVFAARRVAERWSPCGRWTKFVFIFVNPLSGDGSGALWVSQADSNGHYETAFQDLCTRVHIYDLRHGEGGAPEGFALLRRVAAVKHILSVTPGEESKLRPAIPAYPQVAGHDAPAALGGSGASAAEAAAQNEERVRSVRPHALVRAIAVGGDGTVSWVNRAASEAGIHPEWIAVGVVGFGTGNDFAQSYGWGSIDYSGNIFKANILKQYVRQWQLADVAVHDVWRVNVKTAPNGYFEHIDSSTRTFKKILCEKTGQLSTILSGYMTLYFGIGYEALLGLTFDVLRSTSRLRNRMLYGMAFLKHLNRPLRLATEQIETIYVFQDNQKKVLFTTNPAKYTLSFRLQPAISVTFIGTETILGGVKVWAHSRKVGVGPPLHNSGHLQQRFQKFARRLARVKQDMGDQKLELISFRDRFSLMRSVMYEQNAASRLMQHRGPFYVKFYRPKVSGPVPFQVDGEFFLGHRVAGAEEPRLLVSQEVLLTFRYKMLTGFAHFCIKSAVGQQDADTLEWTYEIVDCCFSHPAVRLRGHAVIVELYPIQQPFKKDWEEAAPVGEARGFRKAAPVNRAAAAEERQQHQYQPPAYSMEANMQTHLRVRPGDGAQPLAE